MQRCSPLLVRQRRPVNTCLRRRSFATPALGSFSGVHVAEHGGMPSLLTSRRVRAGEVMFRFTGALIGANTGDRCLQVGRRHWLTPHPEEGEPPWVFLNHSFEPTVHISHPPMPFDDLDGDGQPPAPAPPILTATSNVPLGVNSSLTIDYTLHEWVMSDGGFVCAESGRSVKGFRFLTREQQKENLSRAADHIQQLVK